jgi:hypothetical protein
VPDHDHGLGRKKEVSSVLRDVIELSFPESQREILISLRAQVQLRAIKAEKQECTEKQE